MPWQSLRTTLKTKALVLAGPVLRKVTPTEVTVWLALREPCSVTLTVLPAAKNDHVQVGTRHTVAVGAHLHIVAVTAKQQPPFAELKEGQIYRYDLTFAFDDGTSKTLAGATLDALLSYPGFDKPTFCLPPANVSQLRLIHGSCRIPHGNGADALPLLDSLIQQGAENPNARPHQLLLTGDQIYADDVGFALSMMLGDAGDVLLDWHEEVQILHVPPHPDRMRVFDLSPAVRENALPNAGFTSVDVVNHLIGLGEYLSMYLFVWSDVLWPPGDLPTFDEIVAHFGARESGIYSELGYRRIANVDHDDLGAQTARTSDFRRTVKDVRRALANIPSYMIFDDHDVTDDWNMTRNICRNMYSSQLGLRVVQNALVAYSLCQHWGNTPEQFKSTVGVSPGEKLLLLLDRTSAANYEASSPAIRALVGVHEDKDLATRPDNGLFHDPGAFIYNYAVEGPGHQIIFTDSRSWRSYPRPAAEGGDFLPPAQLKSQIVDVKPPTDERALLVVLTTNAPAAQPVRSASRHPTITRKLAGWFEDDDSPDMYEAWEMPRNATDRLFKAISDRMPLVGAKRQGRAMLLSGDVHTSFASRLLFRGTTRFEDPQNKPQPVNMVFAQLVSSSFRKETDNTEGMHRDGYDYMPRGVGWTGLVPGNKPEGYIGWNLASGVKKQVARNINQIGNFRAFAPIFANGPKTLSIWDAPIGVVADVPPDYSYRLDYLLAVLQASLPDVPPLIPLPLPAGASDTDRRLAADAFHRATGSYRKYNAANVTRREMVGVNNIGELTFDWGPGDAKFAIHTLRWTDWQKSSLTFTTYVVSLDPNDKMFPELKPISP